MKFIELKKQLAQKREACYLLSGDDSFVISSAIKTFEALCALPEMNLIHLTSPSAEDVVGAALVFPVMSPVRVVIVEKFERDSEKLKSYLSSPSPETVIVIVSPGLTNNLKPITSMLTVVDCSRQDENVLRAYIARECASSGTQITTQAANLFIARCNRLMTRISVELQKLIAYKNGGVIESEDVRNLIVADPDYEAYELSNNIASGNGERALEILDDMLRGDTAGKVFGLIYSHFRKLLYVAVSPESDVKTCLGIGDYPYKKLKSQAKIFTPRRLKKICDELHKVDNDYKTGLIGDKLAVTTFTMHIINEGKQ